MEITRLSKRFRSLQIPSRKIINPLENGWPEKQQHKRKVSLMKLRSQSSCESYLRLCRITKRKNSSANKNVMKEFIPSQAKGFNEMVKKKHKLLIIKHKIKNQDQSIPNLLEIRESVKISQINFLRRMDVKLNNTQHANLLSNLKKDLHIKSKNYLRQANEKNKQNRRFLTKQQNMGEQTTIYRKTSINHRWFLD